MQKLFNRILVPVDFSPRSNKAVERAVNVAKLYRCHISLLHVVSISPFAAVSSAEGHITIPYNALDNKNELEFHLKKLRDHAILISDGSIQIDYAIVSGHWDDAVIDKVIHDEFDLVIIGQTGRIIKKRNMLLNPDKIAEKTNVPVITIPTNRRLTKLYSIVIPVTDFLPVRKLMYGVYIGSMYDTTIKLLGIENAETKGKVQYYLNKSSKLIREYCDIKVETETAMSSNVASAINQFAMMKSVDLVIVNPNTQTKMPGFFSTLLGNIIQKFSAPPVLTINSNLHFSRN